MAGYKHDDQGFLIGEIITTNRDLLHSQQQSMSVWRDIRSDVRSIARAVSAQVATASRASRSSARAAVAHAPGGSQSTRAARTAGGNAVATRAAVTQAQGRRAGITASTQAQRNSAAAAASRNTASASVAVAGPVARASDGRFVKGQPRASTQGRDDDSEKTARPGAISRLSDSIGRLSGAMVSSDNIDPTLNAAKEITDVVSPLGRGLFSMFGRTAERKKERWYSRILAALSPRKASTAPTVVAGGGGGGLLGGLGGMGAMLASVPAMLMRVLTTVFLPIAALWGSWELGKWIGEKIYKWLDDSGVMPKVFDAFDAIGESFSGAWTSVKSGFDTVVAGIEGAWKGITDGFSGALELFKAFPTKIGEFFGGLDEAMRGLPIIGKAYAAATDAARGVAGAARSGYAEGANGKTDAPATSGAQALGRDAGKAVAAVKGVGAQAAAGYDAARNGKTDGPAAAGFAQQAARAAGSAAGWVLGQTSKMFESGKGGAGTVSTGKGDNGGASYGTYQLSSKMGTLDKFLKSSGYAAQFEGMAAGSKEFNAKWKDIAQNDASFGAKQHDFIKATHYDPMMAGLKKDGIDLSGRGAAVQDAAWSTSVQFGGGSKLFQKALAGRDHTKMTDAEMVSALQDYKAANNDKLFAKSDPAMRAGTLARAMKEKDALLKMDGAGAGAPRVSALEAVNVASLPPMKMPAIPSSVPDRIEAAPEMKEPDTKLNRGAGAGRGVVQVKVAQDISQNIGDRGIAHVVGGGLGAG